MQENQDKETSTDEVKNRVQKTTKKSRAGGMDVCVVCYITLIFVSLTHQFRFRDLDMKYVTYYIS
jgi:hypothetical protein